MDDLDFDFIAEHPKADMSKVDVIRVNGKEYLAADKVLEIIGMIKKGTPMPKGYQNPEHDGYIDGFHTAVKEFRAKIKSLK